MSIQETLSELHCLGRFKILLLKLILVSIAIVPEFSNVLAFSRKTQSFAGEHLFIIPISAPIQFRFNDSAKLQEYMPRPAKAQIDILNWLAKRYEFTYSVLSTNETTLEKPVISGNRGSLSYLRDRTCDLLLGDMVMTSGRYRLIDMPFPYLQRPLQLLIPVSDARANIVAILKPFQFPVWIFLGVSIASVIAILKIDIFLNKIIQKRAFMSPVFLYVTGIILSQGGPCITRKRTIRLVAGVWSLACFVLVQAYTCTLILYVIAPNNHPLIQSVYDIENNPNIRVLIEKNMGYDIMFSAVTEDTGIFRTLRDRINFYPDSRCDQEYQCIAKVGSGGPYVFPKTLEYLLDDMSIDYKDTGKCRMQIAKEGFFNLLVSFALPKNSPYTTSISEGLMELNAFGLIEYWTKFYAANPHQCHKGSTAKNVRSDNPRLSLKNLTGAFVILAFGYMISFLVFVLERLKFTRQQSRKMLKMVDNREK